MATDKRGVQIRPLTSELRYGLPDIRKMPRPIRRDVEQRPFTVDSSIYRSGIFRQETLQRCHITLANRLHRLILHAAHDTAGG